MFVPAPLEFQPLPGKTALDFGLPTAVFEDLAEAEAVREMLDRRTDETIQIIPFGSSYLLAVIDPQAEFYYFAPASQCAAS